VEERWRRVGRGKDGVCRGSGRGSGVAAGGGGEGESLAGSILLCEGTALCGVLTVWAAVVNILRQNVLEKKVASRMCGTVQAHVYMCSAATAITQICTHSRHIDAAPGPGGEGGGDSAV